MEAIPRERADLMFRIVDPDAASLPVQLLAIEVSLQVRYQTFSVS